MDYWRFGLTLAAFSPQRSSSAAAVALCAEAEALNEDRMEILAVDRNNLNFLAQWQIQAPCGSLFLYKRLH